MAKPRSNNRLSHLIIDPHNRVPAHAQIKAQIKFASTYQEIAPGDVLPSIRTLATQLNIGPGEVRRAYRELCDVGFLIASHRKHIVVTPGWRAAPQLEPLTHEIADLCEQMIVWAREHHVSAIALGRLLLDRAVLQESGSPSYLFVDICQLAAEASAERVARAWDIMVAGMSVADYASLPDNDARRSSAVLVNQFLYDDVLAAAGKAPPAIFPVRMRLGERLQLQVRKLPQASRVLIVLPDELSAQTGPAVLAHYRSVFGDTYRFESKAAASIRDLATLAKSMQYQLVLLSPLVWSRAPSALKVRGSRVARAMNEPDPQSLEATRIAAGVLV